MTADEVQRQARRAHMIEVIEKARARLTADLQTIAQCDAWSRLREKIIEIAGDTRSHTTSDLMAVGLMIGAVRPSRRTADRQEWCKAVLFEPHGHLIRRAIRETAAEIRSNFPA